MLYNAAQLRLFDVLERQGQGMTAATLAKHMDCSPKTVAKLERLLNACAGLGLLVKTVSGESSEALYSNTPDGAIYLTTRSDVSLLPLVDAARHQFDFAEAIKENKWDNSREWFFKPEANTEAYDRILPRFRRYYTKQEGYAKTSVHLLEAFDLSKYKTVVDLGGGLGSVCRAFKKRHPLSDVTCYDMPKVVEFALHMDRQHNRAGEIKYTAGNALGRDPLPKADLYIIGHLLHMFNDQLCHVVLNNVAKALNEGGAILILEKVMNPARDGPEMCLMYDIRMNCSVSQGKERTLEEYQQLLSDTGFNSETLKHHINPGYNIYDAMLCDR